MSGLLDKLRRGVMQARLGGPSGLTLSHLM